MQVLQCRRNYSTFSAQSNLPYSNCFHYVPVFKKVLIEHLLFLFVIACFVITIFCGGPLFFILPTLHSCHNCTGLLPWGGGRSKEGAWALLTENLYKHWHIVCSKIAYPSPEWGGSPPPLPDINNLYSYDYCQTQSSDSVSAI